MNSNISPQTMIITSQQFLQESQSFEVIFVGNGFTRTIDMKLTLHPTPRSAYDIEIVNASAIKLTLKPGHTWLPSFLTLKDDTSAQKIPIQIHEIDTGAPWRILVPWHILSRMMI
jgi:hypothetical protein